MSSPQSPKTHLVVGSGPIGAALARRLLVEGFKVKVVTRSGTGPEGCELIAADASDAPVMVELCRGVDVIYNCVNPAYHRWPTDWPPISHSLLGAAASSGAVLVTVSNLYGYGPASSSLGVASYDARHPMTEETPLAAPGSKGRVRAQMWREALAAFEAGDAKVVEVRAADYIGPRADSVVGTRFIPRVLSGKSIASIGRTDVAHTFTYTEDVARLALKVGAEPAAWGKAWHVPSNAPRTQQDVAIDVAAYAKGQHVAVRGLASGVLALLGLFSRQMRELRETEYQFRDEFVMDSSRAQSAFHMAPTPWSEIIAATVQSYEAHDVTRTKESVQ
jgi:nucleoside-diphosphate-sugar epimerase